MIFIITILALVIIACSYLIFRLKRNNELNKTRKKFSVIKKEAVPAGNNSKKIIVETDENVEVLDLNDKSKNSIEEKADTLDLDDLFKTISLSETEEEKEFEFDLKRSDKNNTA